MSEWEELDEAWGRMDEIGLKTGILPVELQFPSFDKPYDWRSFVPTEIQEKWHDLTADQKYLAAYYAQKEYEKSLERSTA